MGRRPRRPIPLRYAAGRTQTDEGIAPMGMPSSYPAYCRDTAHNRPSAWDCSAALHLSLFRRPRRRAFVPIHKTLPKKLKRARHPKTNGTKEPILSRRMILVRISQLMYTASRTMAIRCSDFVLRLSMVTTNPIATHKASTPCETKGLG